ncbi:MAG: 3-keto-disaccharide hydrolase [Phycisphaeraceae bacterium]
MKNTIHLPVFALAVMMIAGLAYSPANACKKCAKHNTSTEKSDDHGHAHLDEDEGFTTILGEGHTDGWTLGPNMSFQDGMIVAGTMDEKIGKTLYAYHDKDYYNFELRAQAKAVGPEKTNGGFQIRSSVNDKGIMTGYQADMGFKYWGLVYDQGRRNKLLTKHEAGIDLKEDINWGDWNDYRVVCKDNVIEVFINGKLFSKHVEKDEAIAKVAGRIGLQMHSGPPSVRYYRNIRIKELD